MRDVVVVGAGHNALVAACYLAQAGLDVEVVERRDVAGGATATVESFPGYQIDRGASLHILIRHTGIIDELRLTECGLTYLDADPWAFAPFGEEALTFSVNLDDTCASIAKLCGDADADGYARFVADWSARTEAVLAAFQQPPTPRHLGGALWRLYRSAATPAAELARQFLQPANAVLDTYFTDERLKTALAWLAAQSGPPPHETATAELLGWLTLLHSRPPGRAVGGSGSLARALCARLHSFGGQVRLGDGARSIERAGGKVIGVGTESGDWIAARAVLAGCHILTTAALLGDDPWAQSLPGRVRVGDGLGMAVRLATRELPAYPAASAQSYHGMQLVVASRAQLAEAHGDYRAGKPPRRPPCLVMTPSALDPTLAPADRHTVTIWSQWFPYAPAGEDWDAIADREALKLIAVVEAAAPGFAGSVEHVLVQTPHNLERDLGLVHGNVMHVEMSVDAMFSLRPTAGAAGYRTPLDGLYLTGASTHPGGGVFGASGRSAARVLLADRRAPRLSAGWTQLAAGVRNRAARSASPSRW